MRPLLLGLCAGLWRDEPGSPLVYRAWGFVRQVSSELGDAAQSVLSVQSSLNALEVNYTTESDGWQHVKDTASAENLRLKAELARLEAAARQDEVAASETAQLQAALVSVQQDVATAVSLAQAAKARVATEEAVLSKRQLALEQSLAKRQQADATAGSTEFDAVQKEKDHLADLEEKVYADVQLLQATKQAVSAARAKRSARQAALLTSNIEQQQANAKQEADLLQTTQVALSVKHLQDQVASTARQTADLAQGAAALTTHCAAEQQRLEDEVRAQMAQLATQKQLVQRCASIAAESRELEVQLAQCHAR